MSEPPKKPGDDDSREGYHKEKSKKNLVAIDPVAANELLKLIFDQPKPKSSNCQSQPAQPPN